MKREEKIKTITTISFLLVVLFMSLVSAGILGWIKETVTGKATTVPFDLNVSVGGLQIIAVYNQSTAVTINEGPAKSEVIINFSVYSPIGADQINTSSAALNLSFAGEDMRFNNSCKLRDYSGDHANFTCNVTMWWWDINDSWTVIAYIEDNSSNAYTNNTQVQAIGEQIAVQGGPAVITWPGLLAGAENSTANNDPLILNNTGNFPSLNLSVNATNLRGEVDSQKALWGGNFSIGWNNGGYPPAECSSGSSRMSYAVFRQIETANLTKGNYTKDDRIEGQEELYFCLLYAGTEITTQAYSSANETEGPWEVDIIP